MKRHTRQTVVAVAQITGVLLVCSLVAHIVSSRRAGAPPSTAGAMLADVLNQLNYKNKGCSTMRALTRTIANYLYGLPDKTYSCWQMQQVLNIPRLVAGIPIASALSDNFRFLQGLDAFLRQTMATSCVNGRIGTWAMADALLAETNRACSSPGGAP